MNKSYLTTIILTMMAMTAVFFLIGSVQNHNYSCTETPNPYTSESRGKKVMSTPDVYIPLYTCNKKTNDYNSVGPIAYIAAATIILDMAIQFRKKPKIAVAVASIATMAIAAIDMFYLHNKYSFALEYAPDKNFGTDFMIHLGFLLLFSMANFVLLILNLNKKR